MRTTSSHLTTTSDEFRRTTTRWTPWSSGSAEMIEIREGGPEHARKRTSSAAKLLAARGVKKLLRPASRSSNISAHAEYGITMGLARRENHHRVGEFTDARQCRRQTGRDHQGGHLTFRCRIRKHLRAQKSRSNQIACVYMVDSGGAFLPLQSDHFARREQSAHLL